MAEPLVIFYDGVCGLCDRTVRFVVAHDTVGRFRFAPLQSDYAAATLAAHGRDARDVDTVCLLDGATLRIKSDAVLAILKHLGSVWRLASAARVVPRPLRDLGYDVLARHRYRWFGRFDQCALPPPELRERFLNAEIPEHPQMNAEGHR
ncbi:MAG: thiol-disulfide oxidoreductase DCC family protein [bacterium]